MIVYDATYTGEEAEALDYARGMVWMEVESSEQEILHKRFIDTVDGIDVY